MKIEDVDGLENRLRQLSMDRSIIERQQGALFLRMCELEKMLDRFVFGIAFLSAGVMVMLVKILTD